MNIHTLFDSEVMASVKSFPDDEPIPSEKLTVFKRVLREIGEVNDDFHSLRTVIMPDPDDRMNLFYFAMIPNDGAMAHQKLIGRMIIPPDYPEAPPVLHLYTSTRRYNVDVYRFRISRNDLHSSMCFDVLRSKANGGIWVPDFTISCLFASLMQALVSMKVPQEYGGEVTEFVTMEKLDWVSKEVARVLKEHEEIVPETPEIPTVTGLPTPARTLDLPLTLRSRDNKQPIIYSSDAFYLQTGEPDNNVTYSLDLSDLHPGVVFSVVLSNSKTDMTGKKKDTILVRNGVTGSAAKKRVGGQTAWFYHGIPLNRGGLRLTITVANDQFTMVYWDGDRPIVHGDTPISFLSSAEIGDVTGIPFYLNIFLRKKFGRPVTLNCFKNNVGYVHPGRPEDVEIALEREMEKAFEEGLEKAIENLKERESSQNEAKTVDDLEKKKRKEAEAEKAIEEGLAAAIMDPVVEPKLETEPEPKLGKDFPKLTELPLYVALEFSPETTHYLREELENRTGSLAEYPVVRDAEDPGHVTVVFNRDLPLLEYHNAISRDYLTKQGTQIPVKIVGYAKDRHCVTYQVKLPDDLPLYPEGKFPHITMALNGKRPVYSNHLIRRLVKKGLKHEDEQLVEFEKPFVVMGTLKFKGNLPMKKKKLPWME